MKSLYSFFGFARSFCLLFLQTYVPTLYTTLRNGLRMVLDPNELVSYHKAERHNTQCRKIKAKVQKSQKILLSLNVYICLNLNNENTVM